MNSRALVAFGALGWAGVTLLLSQFRWFARVSLAERLRPYSPGGMGRAPRSGLLSGETFREAIGPLSRSIGETLARLSGVSEDLEIRLRRVHAPLDATAFRVRQIGAAVLGFAISAALVLAVAPAGPAALAFLVGGPLVAFLVQEQRLAAASERWQRSLFLELPVVAEQLALLLAAGWSMTSALQRLSTRSRGVVSQDLRRLCRRIRQGVEEADALREWAEIARVPGLDRLVAILALNRDTSDLGRLIAEEARAMRRDVHRELIEAAERRNQQVWIPVTVATLVPGVLFMAIPFVEALRLFGG